MARAVPGSIDSLSAILRRRTDACSQPSTVPRMGLGFNRDQRKKVLGPATGPVTAHTRPVTIVGDGCAIMRRLLGRRCSPVSAANQLARGLKKMAHNGALGKACVSVFFDNAAAMPEERALVSASRARARPAPAGDIGFDPSVSVPGQLVDEYDWEPVLADPVAKAAGWELLGRALFQALCSHRGCSIEVVTAAASYARSAPADALPARGTAAYGEGDILVARRARELAAAGHTTDILTIDYDQVLQAILAPDGPMPAYLTFQGKNSERIDVAKLIERFGGSDRGQRLCAAFFMVCATSTDYSKSLCRPTGTKSAVFVDAMRGDARPLTECATADGGTELRFWPAEFFRVATRPFRACEDASALMSAVLWTIAYFAEYGAAKPRAASPSRVSLPEGWERREYVVVAVDRV